MSVRCSHTETAPFYRLICRFKSCAFRADPEFGIASCGTAYLLGAVMQACHTGLERYGLNRASSDGLQCCAWRTDLDTPWAFR